MTRDEKTPEAAVGRQSWETMTLTYEGHARELVQGGGGKLTPFPSDPGESRKPSPKTGGT